ncbi:hypothetical protein ASG43_02330 [Aureimonas sp. Leaf454]|uniref:hypothetical protein n=1 Tax=Aureimonas sp. Leaf454 TaxID=1736381 RepID=UPI00070067C5|nr:hypothetical protein [Aureimonas sp. Leaf454]KQT54457.1 hypothetical protein ASG43_02330 [Aureimonas sp. Leaf454]
MSRLVIIGNSGSGKSTLAKALGDAFQLPVHELDLIHWLDGGIRRDQSAAKSMVSDCAGGESWIIEGVFGWLAEMALPRATALVWTDLAWSECHDGLLRRGIRRGMTPGDQHELIDWAGG